MPHPNYTKRQNPHILPQQLPDQKLPNTAQATHSKHLTTYRRHPMLKRSRTKKSASRKAQFNRLKSEVLESRRLLAGLEVVAIPFIQENPDIPHPVHEQGNITLKAIARGADSGGDYEIWWDTDFDGNFDNNPSRIVNATNGTDTIYDIGQTFTVPRVDRDSQLDVQVRIRELDTGDEAFGTFHIYVNDFQPHADPRNWTDTQLEVIQQMSVQESMWYVHRNINRYGSFSSAMVGSYVNETLSAQGAKLFLNNQHQPAYAPGTFNDFGQTLPANFLTSNDTRWSDDPYAESALRLLNLVVSQSTLVSIASADEGNTAGYNPNGTVRTVNRLPGTTDARGINLPLTGVIGEAGGTGNHAIGLSAIAFALPALAGTPIQVSGVTSGQSWEWLTQQAVDWLGYAQIDSGTGRGSWDYSAVNGSKSEVYANADNFNWIVAALSDAETVGSPYGVFVDNLHKYRMADAFYNQRASDSLAGYRGHINPGSLGLTAGYVEAARWLGIDLFNQSDGNTAFPGQSNYSRATLRQTYNGYLSAVANAWTQANRRVGGLNWFDSLWELGDYLQGNRNTIYNAGNRGEPLHMLRFANAFREGLVELTTVGSHDWNKEFATYLTRAQDRFVNTSDPWQNYSIFGRVRTSVNAHSWTQNYSAFYWSSVVAGLTMTPNTTNPPKYGRIEAPTQAYARQTVNLSLENAPDFIAIQWDFDHYDGLSWETTGTPDATGQSVTHTYNYAGNYRPTVRGIFADGTSYIYTINGVRVVSNAPPVAEDDAISTGQNTPVMFDVLVDNGSGADQDSDGNLDASLTTALTSPAKGILTQQTDGNFTFDPNGEFDDLPAGESTTVSFDYQIEDVGTLLDTGTVTITITGVNDAATIAGTLTGTTDEDTATAITGAATVSDVDTGEDAFTPQASTAGTYGTFTIDASGNWTYTLNPASVQFIPTGGSQQENFNIASVDGTISQVTITITGNNDAATIAGTLTGTTDEDTATAVTGTATVIDVDTGEDAFVPQASTAGTYGTFSIGPAGNWSFDLDTASVQDLPAGSSYVENFNIASLDGTTSQVTITITGNNDAATFSGILSRSTTEDNAEVKMGTIGVTDVDTGEEAIIAQPSTAGSYGTFTIDANGDFTYTLNQASVQFLNDEDFVDEFFTITSIDGSTTTLNMRINGANDLPSVSIDSVSAFRFVGSPIAVYASATDVDNDVNTIAYNYRIYIDGNASAAFTGNGIDPSPFLFTPSVAGEYRIEVTAIDAAGGESTIDTTITVGSASTVSFLFADDGAVPGDVDNSGPGTEAYFHEWQDALGQLWITIDADVPNTPFDLNFELTSTDNWLDQPQVTADIADDVTLLHQQDAGTLTTTGTLHGLDLSGYQVGDRVLLATLVYPDDLTDPAGLLMDNAGEYVSPTSDHGVQLTSAEVSPTSQPFVVDTNISGQFVPVMYDANDDGRVGIADFAQFISQYSKTADANNPNAYKFDFNWDGKVGITDFAYFISHYGRRKDNPAGLITIPDEAPWNQPPAAAMPLSLEAEPIAQPEQAPLAETSTPPLLLGINWFPYQVVTEFPSVVCPSEPSEEVASESVASAAFATSGQSSLDPKIVDAIYQEDDLSAAEMLSEEEEEAELYLLLADQ